MAVTLVIASPMHPQAKGAGPMEAAMRGEDEVRALVRERYGAIAREAGSCCAPSCCGPEIAPDGLNVIGDAYEGVAATWRRLTLISVAV